MVWVGLLVLAGVALGFYALGKAQANAQADPAGSARAVEEERLRREREAEASEAALTALESDAAHPLAALKRLHVLEADDNPHLHRPLYDASQDEFQLPCLHGTYEDRRGTGPQGIGWHSYRELLSEFGRMSFDGQSSTLVELGDHAVILSSGYSRESGGSAWLFARTAEDRWFVWWWRAGMRPSAADVDPPFHVSRVAADPSSWARREQTVLDRCEANENWRVEARRCGHRARAV